MDPAEQAEWSLIQNYAGEDLLVKEALPRALKQMRAELAESGSSPLEQLLVERVVAAWFQLQYFESLYAQNMRNLTLTQSDYYQRRIDQAHKRNLSAVRTQAQVRRLLKANVAQINIAKQQLKWSVVLPTRPLSRCARSDRSWCVAVDVQRRRHTRRLA